MSAEGAGLDKIREAREGVTELGDKMENGVVGGGTGIGWRETSVMGSQGSEVMISRYLSHS